MRALLVDDEPLARRGLRLLLQRFGDVEIAGESGDPAEASEIAQRDRLDVIFLNIDMPGVDSFQKLKALRSEHRPAFVFVSTYAQHPFPCVDLAPTESLTKPVSPERLRTALQKVRAAKPVHIRVLVHGMVRLLPVSEIERVESQSNYSCIQTQVESIVIRETLSHMDARLDPWRFVRVHRTMIIAVDRVREVRPLPNRDAIAVLSNGEQIRISRIYRQRFEQALGRVLE